MITLPKKGDLSSTQNTEKTYRKDPSIGDVFEQKDYEDKIQILESKVRWALNAHANNKSPGPDNIPIELLKYDEEGTNH